MRIDDDSSIQLYEGEVFLHEKQDPDNIWRTITLRLKSGAIVTVQRHFRQIGPNIRRPDGSKIETYYNREDNSVTPKLRPKD